MTGTRALESVREGLAEIPLLDVHTHLDAAHLAARGLHDVLLYHMVVSDLAQRRLPQPGAPVGGPERGRGAGAPGRGHALTCPTSATPAASGACASSCGTCMALTSRPTEDNWRRDCTTRSASAPATPPGRARSCAAPASGAPAPSCWRGHDGSADDVFQYALEWAFFARAPVGRERHRRLRAGARLEPGPGPEPPLPVTIGATARPVARRTIRTRRRRARGHRPLRGGIPFGKVHRARPSTSPRTSNLARRSARRDGRRARAPRRRPGRPSATSTPATSSRRS